ncbi:hypothetical protein [Owenweeksia hongkongensis]|uniref:hypothetical protein n=1 Tax=Owenweeksia hongkongensis TaxID=253245 RepID=UPI003A958F01
MRKLFVLFCALSLFHLHGQSDSILPEIFESDFSDQDFEYFTWPDMKMEYDTLEKQTYNFGIDTISVQVIAARIIIREYTEVGKASDSVVWDLTNIDTAIVHDWTGTPKKESVWVPFEAGFYKLDTLWDPSEPNRWLEVDTATGRDVYADFFLQGSKNEIFQVNDWLEHFAESYPNYVYNMYYFNGRDWVRMVTRKRVSSLEKEFLLNTPKGISWFSIYLSASEDSDLAPYFGMTVKLIE